MGVLPDCEFFAQFTSHRMPFKVFVTDKADEKIVIESKRLFF